MHCVALFLCRPMSLKSLFFSLSDICLDLILNVVQDVDQKQQIDQELLKEVSKCRFTYSSDAGMNFYSWERKSRHTLPRVSPPAGNLRALQCVFIPIPLNLLRLFDQLWLHSVTTVK